MGLWGKIILQLVAFVVGIAIFGPFSRLSVGVDVTGVDSSAGRARVRAEAPSHVHVGFERVGNLRDATPLYYAVMGVFWVMSFGIVWITERTRRNSEASSSSAMGRNRLRRAAP